MLLLLDCNKLNVKSCLVCPWTVSLLMGIAVTRSVLSATTSLLMSRSFPPIWDDSISDEQNGQNWAQEEAYERLMFGDK